LTDEEPPPAPVPVPPSTWSASLDLQRALLAHNGRHLTLCDPQLLGSATLLIECDWPELSRALGVGARQPVRCLVAPWEESFGIPAEAFLAGAIEAARHEAHAILLVTSSPVAFPNIAWLAASARVHAVLVDAVTRRMLESPDAFTPLSRLLYESRVPPARHIDPVVRIRDMAADARAAADFRERMGRLTGWAPVTAVMCVICLFVFAAMVLSGVSVLQPCVEDLESWGANGGFLVVQGQWWRYLTSAFVHVGFVHLLLNLWCLWHLGQFVERLFGSATFAAVCLLTAAGGALASVAWRPYIVSAGASGVVFGICGALLGFLIVRRKTIPRSVLHPLARNISVFVGINLVFGFTWPMIDNAAHLGGLVTGVACGLALSRNLAEDPPRRLAGRLAIAAGLAAALAVAAFAVDRGVLRSPKWASMVFLRACAGTYDADVGSVAESLRQMVMAIDRTGTIAGAMPERLLGLEQRARRAREAMASWPASGARDHAVQCADAVLDAIRALDSLARSGSQRHLHAAAGHLQRFADSHKALLAERGAASALAGR